MNDTQRNMDTITNYRYNEAMIGSNLVTILCVELSVIVCSSTVHYCIIYVCYYLPESGVDIVGKNTNCMSQRTDSIVGCALSASAKRVSICALDETDSKGIYLAMFVCL